MKVAEGFAFQTLQTLQPDFSLPTLQFGGTKITANGRKYSITDDGALANNRPKRALRKGGPRHKQSRKRRLGQA